MTTTRTPAAPRVRAIGRPKPWLHVALGYLFGPGLRFILNMRVRGAEYVPSTGAVIVAGNHRGL
ncbi:MAG TPA: hypothetical protein VNA14_08625, partial [Mycobacteriales bacterium]|nr:hypothetical protein [Mycobacteriales bacterium]